VLVVNLSTIIIPEVVAEIADFLIRLEGIETVLSMGHYNDKVILSIRTINHDINAGEIIQKLVAGRGTAGGHGMTAGGKLDDVPFNHATMHEIEDFLTKKLLAELSLEYSLPHRLIK
jgi:nanoRNase/pAp phosphatase (c-di-AMP/oligoRNAs hydrolase)